MGWVANVASGGASSVASTSLNIGTACPIGGTILLVFRLFNNGIVSSVVDSKGNRWFVEDGTQSAAGAFVYRSNLVTALTTADTITITATTSQAAGIFGIADLFSNIGTSDANTSIIPTRTSPNLVSVTATANDYCAWTADIYSGNAGSLSLNSPFTASGTGINSTVCIQTGYDNSVTAGTLTASWNNGANHTSYIYVRAFPDATTKTETYEEGTNGTTITTGNSSYTGNVVNNGTFKFDNTHVEHGLLAGESATTTAGKALGQFNLPGTSATAYMRMYTYWTAYPAGAYNTFFCGNSVNTLVFRMTVQTTGKLTCDTAGTSHAISMNNALPLNQWNRIEATVFGDPTNGTLTLSTYTDANSLTATETQTATGQNTTGNPFSFQYGIVSNSANIGPIWTDDCAASDIGPLGPSIPVFASAFLKFF